MARLITEFKDINGFAVAIVPQNVFSVRRMTQQEDRKDEVLLEVQSTGGSTVEIVEEGGLKFLTFLAERLE